MASNRQFLKIVYYVKEGEPRYVTFYKFRCMLIVGSGLLMTFWMAASLVGAALLFKQTSAKIIHESPKLAVPKKAGPR